MADRHKHNFELLKADIIGDLEISIYRCRGINCKKEHRFEKIIVSGR
jgi:hypothetical protein